MWVSINKVEERQFCSLSYMFWPQLQISSNNILSFIFPQIFNRMFGCYTVHGTHRWPMMYSCCWACENNKVLVVLIYKVYDGCNMEVLDNLIEKDGTKKRSKKGLKKSHWTFVFRELHCIELWLANRKGTNLICKE